jgi:hypothetical protein
MSAEEGPSKAQLGASPAAEERLARVVQEQQAITPGTSELPKREGFKARDLPALGISLCALIVSGANLIATNLVRNENLNVIIISNLTWPPHNLGGRRSFVFANQGNENVVVQSIFYALSYLGKSDDQTMPNDACPVSRHRAVELIAPNELLAPFAVEAGKIVEKTLTFGDSIDQNSISEHLKAKEAIKVAECFEIKFVFFRGILEDSLIRTQTVSENATSFRSGAITLVSRSSIKWTSFGL